MARDKTPPQPRGKEEHKFSRPKVLASSSESSNNKVDKLGIYLEKVVDDVVHETPEMPAHWKTRAHSIMERICRVLFSHEKRFTQTFETPPVSLASAKGGHVLVKGKNHFQLRLVVKRFSNPNAAEVR